MQYLKLLFGSLLQFLKSYWKEFILFGCVFTFLLCFVFWFIGQEKTIYMYDYANYHRMFTNFGETFVYSKKAALYGLISSIRHHEYNLLQTVFLFPFYYLFGESRISFISAVAVIYSFPTIVLFSFLTKKIVGLTAINNETEIENSMENKTSQFGLTLIPTVFLALFPAFWNPIVLGFPDVGGVGVIFFIFILYFRKPLLKQSIFELILMGLMLSFLILFRRWYAYWVIGFFGASTVYELLYYNWQNRNLRELFFIFRNIGIIGFTAVTSFFIIAAPIAKKILFTDYSDLYAGYRQGNSPAIALIFFGPSLLLICLIGVVFSFLDKKLRPYTIFGVVLFVTAYILFTRTQDIHPHHLYWVISIFSIFGAVLLCRIYQRLTKTPAKVAFLLITTLFCAANFGSTFFPNVKSSLGFVRNFFPNFPIAPKIRTDFEQINALLGTLDNLTKNSDKKIYVLTASETLSDDTLRFGCDYFKPEFGELRGKILGTNQIDSRDGFPFQMLTAGYVVVTIPTDYLHIPNEQRVLGVLSEQLYLPKNIGNAYQRLNYDFKLDDGRNVYIYEKKRNFTESELQEISEIFLGFYPNKRKNFEIDSEMIRELSK